MSTKIETVYLWRKGNSQYLADAFFSSWLRHDPGAHVKLTVLLKGFDGRTPELPKNLAARLDVIHVSDNGFDLTVYKQLALAYPEKSFFFLNSYSRLESPNWYDHLSAVWKTIDGRGLIGASGSWETVPGSPPFPNTHLRTNGFVVSARDYLLATGSLASRQDCLLTEAGKNSLTKYFLRRELPVLIVGASGEAFCWKDWPNSKTFRCADQDHLLVSDNRTRHYHHGSRRKRNLLAKASWGDRSNTQAIGTFERLKRLIWNKYLYFGHKLRLPALLRSSRS